MKKLFLTPLLLLVTLTALFAKELRIVALNKRLDKVIQEIGVEVSFNGRALSKYKISIDKSFISEQHAIEFLLKDKPFICEQIGGVYVISPKAKEAQAKQRKQLLPEPYPYQNNVLPEIQMINLGEVVITAPQVSYTQQSGVTSAESTIDHRAAKVTPGSSDNSVFNLLRMIPGVRATFEPSDELIVWGSMAGESRVVFDGIPLFGMRGFNDNISFINPYLVKDIKLMKGGYGAKYGNQIGAIAQIQGITPIAYRPSVKASVSTLTANVYASVPITKQSALQVAYRRTLYDLYSSSLLNPYNGKKFKNNNSSNKNSTLNYITPEYSFSDLNISYSGKTASNGIYKVSLYGVDDKFAFTAEPKDGAIITGGQNSKQIGGAASYNHIWKNTSHTNIALSFAKLVTNNNEINSYSIDNKVGQISGAITHFIPINNTYQLEMGGEFDYYKADNDYITKPTLFLGGKLNFRQLTLNASLRGDFIPNKVNLQPRLSASYAISKRINATLSWGLYNQYLSKIPFKIDEKSYLASWAINDNLNAMHTVMGVGYNSLSGFSITVEGFVKNVKNTYRFIDKEFHKTNVNLYGGDLFVKKDFLKGAIFGSYSVNHIAEDEPETGHELKIGGYFRLKSFTFSANYVYGSGFSLIDYATGQGQGNGNGNGRGNGNGNGNGAGKLSNEKSYSRLDASVVYGINLHSIRLQAGVSVMNIFDTENLKYSYSANSKQDPITLYSGALPFTPMVFLEFIW